MSSERRILSAATVMHAVVGIVIATWVTGPILAIDDVAYLSMGYTLAGEGAAPLAGQPPYGFLYPMLLAPGWLVGLGESQMVVYGQVLNALLGAALLPTLYLLVRRVARLPFAEALVAAAIGASLPAALLTSNIVWTETLLPLLIALAMLALLRFHETPSLIGALAIAAAALALYATHPRMIVVAILVLVAGMAARSRVAVFVAGFVGLRLVELLRVQIAEATFGSGGDYDAGDLAARRGIDDIVDMAVHGGGTIAYLLLASAGLVALGAIVLVKREPAAAIVYGAVTVSIVFVAGWFLTGVDRADAFLHGRYIEVSAPLLVALGVIGARELPRRVSLSVVTTAAILAGWYGAWAGPGENWARGRTSVMMLGTEVSGAPFGGTFFEPGAAASTALIVGVLMIMAARRRTVAPVLVLAVALMLAIPSGIAALELLQDNSAVGDAQAILADEEVGLIVVDTDLVPSNIAAAVAWEVGFDRATENVEVGSTHLLLTGGAAAPPNARLVGEFRSGSTDETVVAAVWALE